jgi:hypothetical protein
MSIGGRTFDGCISMRPNTEIEYDLNGLFDTFSAGVGLDGGARGDRKVEFVVVGDGKELWRSDELTVADGLKSLKLNISGVRRLVLRVAGAGQMRRGPMAGWVEADVIRGSDN